MNDMESVSIRRLSNLPRSVQATVRLAQQEAGRVWTECVGLHVDCRQSGQDWPDRKTLQAFTKGRFNLHSQTVQMICHQVLANVDATRQRRKSEPQSREWLRYPYKDKAFFPLSWPAQAVS